MLDITSKYLCTLHRHVGTSIRIPLRSSLFTPRCVCIYSFPVTIHSAVQWHRMRADFICLTVIDKIRYFLRAANIGGTLEGSALASEVFAQRNRTFPRRTPLRISIEFTESFSSVPAAYLCMRGGHYRGERTKNGGRKTR